MTDDEKRQQKAMLLLEYQEAEGNLAHLREKASRMQEPFRDIASWLNSATLEFRKTEDFQLNANVRSNAEAYRKAMNFDSAVSLMDEIQKAEKTVEELARRKSALGLK